MKEVLTKLRDRLEGQRVSSNPFINRYGLCRIVEDSYSSGEITANDMVTFNQYLRNYINSTSDNFWEYRSGVLHDTANRFTPNTWVWNPHDKQVRIDWLNEHIKLNS